MLNKRGQELSTNAIIMIVIGIIVLVVLILGFTMGFDRLLPFFSSNNVQNIKTACSAACTTSSQYDFCTFERTLKADDLPGDVKEVVGNCSFFSGTAYAKYDIQACPSLDCTP